ncbi:MAG: hypothetical protein OEZ22_14800, partial [Spirochaetia bacterium]|nr:hypothetical protein [Spirochaetia bacterium]
LAAKLIANRFCLTAFFGQELRLIRPHQAYKNDLQRLVRLSLSEHLQFSFFTSYIYLFKLGINI